MGTTIERLFCKKIESLKVQGNLMLTLKRKLKNLKLRKRKENKIRRDLFRPEQKNDKKKQLLGSNRNDHFLHQ